MALLFESRATRELRKEFKEWLKVDFPRPFPTPNAEGEEGKFDAWFFTGLTNHFGHYPPRKGGGRKS